MAEQTQQINLQSIEGSKAISELAKSWDNLFSRAVYAPPYLSRAWINVFIEEKRFKGTPLFITAWDGNKLVALLSLAIRRYPAMRVAKPIGTGHPSYLGLLLDPNYLFVVESLADFIRSEKIFNVYLSHDLSSEDQATSKLLDELVKIGYMCLKTTRNPCFYIKMGFSYDEYLLQTKSSRRRKKLQYEEKRLLSSAKIEITQYRGKEITKAVYDRIQAIQDESWMERRGANELRQTFRRALILEMAGADHCLVWLMQIDEEDAAFVLALANGGRLQYYRTAFKLKFESKMSIGKILTMNVIRDACEQQITCFDFGHGYAEYKKFWSTDSHDVKRVIAGCGILGRFTAFFYYVLWQMAKVEWLKQLFKSLKNICHFFQPK